MAMTTPQSQLVEYLQNALAMEEAVIRALDDMVETTIDEELRGHFERHRKESGHHAARLRGRLEAHGAQEGSSLKELAGKVAGKVKGAFDSGSEPTSASNARDAYIAEHVEIASYELLERVARAANDEASAEVVRMNREEDAEMAARIATCWDRVAVAGLVEEGALLGGPPPQPDPGEPGQPLAELPPTGI